MDTALHQEKDIVIYEGDAAEKRLADLGLSSESVKEAVTQGHTEAIAHAGDEYPRTGKGLARWITTVGVLRRAVAEEGTNEWERNDDRNRPTLVNSKKHIVLSVAAGNSAVGAPEQTPNFVRAKGNATRETLQYCLFSRSDLALPVYETWFLLYYPGKNSVHCEVSLGRGDNDGFVEAWDERIILNFENLEDDSSFVEGGEDVDFGIS